MEKAGKKSSFENKTFKPLRSRRWRGGKKEEPRRRLGKTPREATRHYVTGQRSLAVFWSYGGERGNWGESIRTRRQGKSGVRKERAR